MTTEMDGRQALLVMDMQQAITAYFPAALLQQFAHTIEAARTAHVPVIYVTVRWRPGGVDVSPRNRFISALAPRGGFFEGDTTAAIDERLAPQDGEVVVTKRRVGAFSGSDLELVLRSQNIDTLVLTGIGTSGVVLSTLIEAAEMDYRLIVLKDCCGDASQEVHQFLTEKIFPTQSEVMTAAEWIGRLKGVN
ncbi:MAG: cysteine hydrolase [Anaerolineae bacterium]|nr:cysteine hydrolase [Anaerolineae bacterium]